MRHKIKRTILAFMALGTAAVLIAGIAIWPKRYALLYEYYLWKSNRTDDGKDILIIQEKVESIAPNIVPKLVSTYEDTKATEQSRHIAGLALISVDKEQAEELYIKFLNSDDDVIQSSAIFFLGAIDSKKVYEDVVEFLESPSDDVRGSVMKYLGDIDDLNVQRSMAILKEFKENDPSEHVRGLAAYSLGHLEKVQ